MATSIMWPDRVLQHLTLLLAPFAALRVLFLWSNGPDGSSATNHLQGPSKGRQCNRLPSVLCNREVFTVVLFPPESDPLKYGNWWSIHNYVPSVNTEMRTYEDQASQNICKIPYSAKDVWFSCLCSLFYLWPIIQITCTFGAHAYHQE